MAVTIMKKKEVFCCPRCGGQQRFKKLSNSGTDFWVVQKYDDEGNRVERYEVNMRAGQPTMAACINPHCGALYVREHWEPNAKQVPSVAIIEKLLTDLAIMSGVTSYKDLSLRYQRETGFHVHHHFNWDTKLGELCTINLAEGRPMLSALVINEKDGIPGASFSWKRLGVDYVNRAQCWRAWTAYKRRLHRYYYNQQFRPWLAKPVTHF